MQHCNARYAMKRVTWSPCPLLRSLPLLCSQQHRSTVSTKMLSGSGHDSKSIDVGRQLHQSTQYQCIDTPRNPGSSIIQISRTGYVDCATHAGIRQAAIHRGKCWSYACLRKPPSYSRRELIYVTSARKNEWAQFTVRVVVDHLYVKQHSLSVLPASRTR